MNFTSLLAINSFSFSVLLSLPLPHGTFFFLKYIFPKHGVHASILVSF